MSKKERWNKIKTKLRPYQQDGVKFIQKYDASLLADDMGLGKTIQYLAYLSVRTDLRPALIVCPAVLKFNWLDECETWLPNDQIYVAEGMTPKPEMKKAGIVITGYATMRGWKSEFIKNKFKAAVADESHFLKNRTAQRTKYTLKVFQTIQDILFMTGTPIENNPYEIFTTVNFIAPDIFPSHFQFLQRYCKPRFDGYKLKPTGATNVPELRKKLYKNEIMLRRTKTEVLKDLPDKIRSVIPVKITNYKLYNKKINLFRAQQNEEDVSYSSKVYYVHLKQVLGEGKIKPILDFIQTLGNKKAIIFCEHINVIDQYKDALGRQAVVFDGRITSTEDRKEIVSDFNTKKNIQFLIGQIKAAGKGINLTSAEIVIMAELNWNMSVHEQAEDRAYRYGQTKNVNCYYFIAKNTIDTHLLKKIKDRGRIVKSIMKTESKKA